MQILEEYEGCGADEALPTRLKDESDDEDEADDDDGGGSIYGDSTTQQQLQQPNLTTGSNRAAPKHTLEECELRNRPIRLRKA